jgi:hypothetical protein
MFESVEGDMFASNTQGEPRAFAPQIGYEAIIIIIFTVLEKIKLI